MRVIVASVAVWLLILTWIVVKPSASAPPPNSDFPGWWYGADSSQAAAIAKDCEERYARRTKRAESLIRLGTIQDPDSSRLWRVLTTDALTSLITELETERAEPNKCARAEIRLDYWRKGIEPSR
ncbi:MAG: hypothetical protein ACT4PM_13735 [Gemmatimonadales bacterium]